MSLSRLLAFPACLLVWLAIPGSLQAQSLNESNFNALCLGTSGSVSTVTNAGREYSVVGDVAAFPFSIQVQRKRCPADPRRVFLNVSLQPPVGSLLFQLFPKITVAEEGRELGWFGSQALAGRGNQTSVAVADQDFQWWWTGCNFDCSNLYRSSSWSAPLKPRAHVQMDASRRLTLRAEMTGYGLYQGRSVVIDIAELAEERPVRGLWMNPAEPGWGLFIEPGESGAWFATWYAYDSHFRPVWFVMPNGRKSGDSVRGEVYSPRAQDGFDVDFNPANVDMGDPVGEFVIHLAQSVPYAFDFHIEGVHGSKPLQPLILRDRKGKECNAENGVWWNPAQSGMAVVLHGAADKAGEGCFLHAQWTTYDSEGFPTWYFSGLGPGASPAGQPAYQGELFSTRGPDFSRDQSLPLSITREGSWTLEREADGARQRHVLRKGDRQQTLLLERFRF